MSGDTRDSKQMQRNKKKTTILCLKFKLHFE